MTPIQFALAEIRDEIPEEILKIAFTPKTKYQSRKIFTPATIEQQILDKVINGKVRRHIDIQGAQEIVIPLNGLARQYTDNQAWYCHIPKSMTKGRRIISVIGVFLSAEGWGGGMGALAHGGQLLGQGFYNNAQGNCQNSGAMINTIADVVNSYGPTEMNYTANVYLVEENTIFCEDNISLTNLALRCKISSDEEFSFIQGGYIRHFSKLCLLATKAWIFKNTIVEMDKAYIEGGVEVGRIKEIIDGYSDANQEFDDFIQEKWRKIQRMTDKPRRMNYLNGLITKGF